MKAHVEDDLKWSLFDSKVRFTMHPFSREKVRGIMDFRKANMKTTDMCWITLRPTIDCGFTVYNPKALIMLILN